MIAQALTDTTPVDRSQTDWLRAALMLVVAGLVYYAFFVQFADRGMSTYDWLLDHWLIVSNYSHGPLIPLIASGLLWWNLSRRHRKQDWRLFWTAFGSSVALLIFPSVVGSFAPSLWWRAYWIAQLLMPFSFAWQLWTLRKELAIVRSEPMLTAGLTLLSVAMVVYYVGIKAVQPRLTVFSFVVLLLGLTLIFGGRALLRVLFFPIVFLLLMIPLNFLDEQVGLPLQFLMARSSVALLNWLGIETVRVGTGIYSSVFRFDVAAPCSGIRSLMALTTVTAAYAYVTQHAQWKRWALFLSAMPLAVLGNIARVFSIALVAQVYGQELATKAYHDWSGYIVFGVALTTMVVLGLLLNFQYRRLWENWFAPVAPPPHASSEEMTPVLTEEHHE